jgi:hypothetical protein
MHHRHFANEAARAPLLLRCDHTLTRLRLSGSSKEETFLIGDRMAQRTLLPGELQTQCLMIGLFNGFMPVDSLKNVTEARTAGRCLIIDVTEGHLGWCVGDGQ